MSEEKVKTEIKKENIKGKSPYDIFGTNKKNEDQGVALDYGNFAIIIKRAGPNNNAYKNELRRINDSKGKRIQIGAVSDEEMEDDLIHLFARTVVLGWRNVTDSEGNEILFTPDNCYKLFKDLPDLFYDVRDQAMDFKTFKDNELEEVSKNS